MPRKRTETTEVPINKAFNGDATLAESISGLLRSLGTTLGIAYSECATSASSIAALEQAKDALLEARRQTTISNGKGSIAA